MRKPVFKVSDQVRHNPGCGLNFWILELEVLFYLYVEKTKALISCATYCTANLCLKKCFPTHICAKSKFSHDTAQNDLLAISRETLTLGFPNQRVGRG